MNHWISRGILSLVGLMGLMVVAGCGGGGGDVMPGPGNLGYVRTAETPGVVELSWAPSPSKGLLGYTVSRRRVDEPTFSLVTGRPISGTTFTDVLSDPSEIRTLIYQVIAVQWNGRVSEPVEVTAVVSPPAPPDGF
jgi:hypothetical protein